MVAASFLSTFFLALAVAANPVERKTSLAQLRFARRVSANSNNFFRQDQLRAKFLKGGKSQGVENRAVVNSQADNRAVTYIASVGVGSPPTNCK